MSQKLTNPETTSTVDFKGWTTIDTHMNAKFLSKEDAVNFIELWAGFLKELENDETVVVDSRIGISDPLIYEKTTEEEP